MKLYNAHTSAQACVSCVNYTLHSHTLFPDTLDDIGATCGIDNHSITYLHCFDQTCDEFERSKK